MSESGNLKGRGTGNTDGRERGTDGDPDPPPAKREGTVMLSAAPMSYVAMAKQGRKALFPAVEIPKRQPATKEGKPAIVFTMAETGACSKQLDHALIAKFSNGRPHISAVEKEFRATWRIEGRMIVSDLDGRHILIILESEKEVIAALTQAPRRVGTSLYRLFKWTPEFHLRRESTIITVWVRFPHLRPDLFNEGILRCLCQPFNRYLDSDDHTKNRTRCAFARCCVEIDLAKKLPGEIWIDPGDGNGWWQEISYEGNLKYCSKCRLHGHNLAECRKVKTQERKGTGPDQRQGVQGNKQKEEFRQVQPRQNLSQEWIPAHGRKNREDNDRQMANNEIRPRREEYVGMNNPFNPILVEEEESGEIREENAEGETDQVTNMLKESNARLQKQNKNPLNKSNSEANLEQLDREEVPQLMEYLTRSQSLNDIPKHCTERRLEYLQEEFHHFHLIHKHLQKTKVETLARLKLMEEKKKQNQSVQEESQQESRDSGQEGTEFVVPETQMGSSQSGSKGGKKQKNKQANQSVSKPLTRAAKKHQSPKKK